MVPAPTLLSFVVSTAKVDPIDRLAAGEARLLTSERISFGRPDPSGAYIPDKADRSGCLDGSKTDKRCVHPRGNQDDQVFRVTVIATTQFPARKRLHTHGHGADIVVMFGQWSHGHEAIQLTHAGQFDATTADSRHR